MSDDTQAIERTVDKSCEPTLVIPSIHQLSFSRPKSVFSGNGFKNRNWDILLPGDTFTAHSGGVLPHQKRLYNKVPPVLKSSKWRCPGITSIKCPSHLGAAAYGRGSSSSFLSLRRPPFIRSSFQKNEIRQLMWFRHLITMLSGYFYKYKQFSW